MRWEELKGFWSDAGTFDSLFKASKYWAGKKGIK
jgi:glucose-1-phosphate thymidylyltransferase